MGSKEYAGLCSVDVEIIKLLLCLKDRVTIIKEIELLSKRTLKKK